MQLESPTLLHVWPLISCRLLVSHSGLLSNYFLTDSHFYLASLCDVEHGFSCSGLTVSKLRHGLSDASTCTSTVLHAWSKIPGLIPESEIIQVFKDKCCRLKTGKDIMVIDSDSGGISNEE